MAEPFRSFVIFAGMRTGSNLLEATLNRIRRVTCFGEAFNPYMMGWPDKDELLGITRAEREADPLVLLARITGKPDHLPGFRYFHDHDPRVFDPIMADRSCAKIVLTRNPADSYVSTRLARETNQWKLNETETPAPAATRFDPAEFQAMLAETDGFLSRILRGLQETGQAAFWLSYDDLREASVMTGLLHWLGRSDLDRVEPAADQVPQNPREMAEKVENLGEMRQTLAALDRFDLTRIPGFEPRRGPAVPSFLASEGGRGLIFMPVRGGPTQAVRDWLGACGPLADGFTQAGLRQWKRDRPGHRGFTVIRHPLHRAWAAFGHLLAGARPELRQLLREVHRVALPADPDLPGMGAEESARHFAAFLDFLRRNLHGQTSLPTHPIWASQAEVIAGFARFGSADLIAREDRLAEDLDWLARSAGIDAPAAPAGADWPDFLEDRALVTAARQAYLRDYVTFGFPPAPGG